MNPHTLELTQAEKQFASNTIFHDLSFHVHQDEVLSIVGPSGSGKTTLLRTIAGLEGLSQGRIILNGKDVTRHKAHHRAISFVFQQPLLFPHMNVWENISYGAKLNKTHSHAKTEDLLRSVDLAGYETAYPFELSGGQKQRVALARSLAIEPSLLLLDEPFSSLDPTLRHGLRYWVRNLLKTKGITAVFVTHDHEEALLMGDRVAVFHEGTFQQIGKPDQIHEYPANPYVARFLGSHIILDDDRYAPLKACYVTTETPADSVLSLSGTADHITYHHGQRLGHLYLPHIHERIVLPIPLHVSPGEEIRINVPREHIQTFSKARYSE
ncbi:ABC transporter ATP-binding protein [Thalassobacillus sp. CUG 92003]|uniref:ABC transporter ATP-binding protein n=1 Tax=Thalassobacillus sp. CUG 92003 TaxID=2736641 RepID=UPI0015E7E203|nr:ABC transporter ATP-binding protein [Thalassobacillus sp. CUG 92003]